MKSRTCPVCGKSFIPLLGSQKYCCIKHRKRAENSRLREGTLPTLADYLKGAKKGEQNQQVTDAMREDGRSPSSMVRQADWIAVNEITHKFDLNGRAIGWAIRIDRQGGTWFGRVKDDRGDYTFGYTTLVRAKDAVSAWIKQEPFEKRESERSWRGGCLGIV